jgi:hypothetical protein
MEVESSTMREWLVSCGRAQAAAICVLQRQLHSSWAAPVAGALSFCGNELCYSIALPLVAWTSVPLHSTLVVTAWALTYWLNGALKVEHLQGVECSVVLREWVLGNVLTPSSSCQSRPLTYLCCRTCFGYHARFISIPKSVAWSLRSPRSTAFHLRTRRSPLLLVVESALLLLS